MNTYLWGLFHWSADGIYRESDALKIYKRQSAAERAAMRLYDESNGASDVVARRIYY